MTPMPAAEAAAQSVTTFANLSFNPHPNWSGVQALTFFPNGYGASVIRAGDGSSSFSGSYGADRGLYELAVLRGDAARSKIACDTPLTDDVLGELSEADVTRLLAEIAALPQAEAAQ